MLTRKTKYALNALAYLARSPGRGPVQIAELAREERIPKKYLERILLDLKVRGVLRSQKGKGGGYYLGRKPEKISLSEIVRLMDGPLAPVSCVSETAYERCSECRNEAACGIRLVMKEVRDAIAEILDGTSLADMVRRSQAAQRSPGSLDYDI